LILIYRCLDRNPRLLETLTINIYHCPVCVKQHSQSKERKKETFGLRDKEPPHSILEMMKDYNALRQEQPLKSVQEESNLCCGNLYAKPRKFDSLTRLVDENEQCLQSIQQELNAEKRESDSLTKLVDENEQRLQSIQQELNAKQREFDCLSLTGLIKERHYEVDEKEKRLREKVENQVKDLESKEIFYQVRANLCKYLMSMTLIHLNQLNDAIIWKKY